MENVYEWIIFHFMSNILLRGSEPELANLFLS